MKNYSQALKILLGAKIKIKAEYIDVAKSLKRVNSKDVYLKTNNPSNNNSSLDGYAINSKDTSNISKKGPKLFKILGSIYAGDKPIKKKN